MAGNPKKEAEKELKRARKIAPDPRVEKDALMRAKLLEEEDKELLPLEELEQDDSSFIKEAEYAGHKLLSKSVWYLKKHPEDAEEGKAVRSKEKIVKKTSSKKKTSKKR